MEPVQKQLNGQTRSRGQAAEEEERREPGEKGEGKEKEKFSLSSDSRGVEVGNLFCAFFLCLIYNIF